MRLKSLSILAISAALLAGCATPSTIAPHLTSLVRVNTAGGHGSGVYIGNDIVITAAHVVKGETTVNLLSESRYVQSGAVLWASAEYDIAAIKVSNGGQYRAASLICSVPRVGESITAAGSPLDEDFLYIPGTVAGTERRTGPWASVVPASLPITSGNSGGPVFDSYDNVVGIVVGGMTSMLARTVNPTTLADFDRSQTGISYVVPASTVCRLLGRGVV